MAVRRPIAITAKDEVEWTEKYSNALISAGWEAGTPNSQWRSIPFCSRNQVLVILFRGVHKGLVQSVHLEVPMAHRLYEKRFLNALKKNADALLNTLGLTLDADVNAVMRMCL